MMAILLLNVVPLLSVMFLLWAGWLALAAEADAVDIPRILSEQLPAESGRLSVPRALHLAHLALLVLAGAAAGTAVAWWAWTPAGAVVRLFLTAGLVWVVGDLLPRLLAAVAPELATVVHASAVRTLSIFRPLLKAVAWADRHGQMTDAKPPSEGGAARRDMLLGLFSLADTTVAEVMTPRIDIVAVDAAAERDEVIETLRSSEHSRLVVFDGHPDSVVGILYAKDVLSAGTGSDRQEPWHSLIRPPAFVPEGKTLDRQLRDFQRGPSHLAVVVDEFGGTSGLVTLEDVLEQIVGEIQDEYDTDEVAPIAPGADDTLLV